MDHQPPPFFKRGPAPLALLSIYFGLSVSLLVLDHRFHYLELLRKGIATVVLPVQQAVQTPLRAMTGVGSYFYTVDALKGENQDLQRRHLEDAAALSRVQQLEAENQRLRRLLEMRERLATGGKAAQILYGNRDPFTRRVVVDKGSQAGLTPGQPVIDDIGVIGQVTRTYPFLAEVTLITDKDQAVPVQVVRNGLRSVVFGLGNGALELRYMPANADVQNGDVLVTSGLDGVFPAGFPVAKVVRIERDASYSFARIICAPLAGVEQHGDVLVINSAPAVPARPEPEAKAENEDKAGDRATNKSNKLKKARQGRN
ncbi:rod shape-determining protein MreC [Oryzomicrobium terrae]|uniref:Cell shape-determining protein MreC n=1 Tax=Oryzomicrobium terrae TaxID=1735038 RepID=A0A5C1E3U7_9RHOO|nr:rod shape-determining protein MreC [Oryzomicrobium terrae]QEL63596.1 rod shape-determining protein MreC [Oryzomicrobium terrae]